MKTTLLLCFIHGFKGGDDTFGSFPEHLRAIVSHALPDINVVTLTYPKFETRGDLLECVSRFKEWLQNKVIDLEVANETPSPTIDPSVHTILIGHSMGGIVAAETVLSIISDEPLSPSTTTSSSTPMFPHITGILAFDTPYLGIHPGVVAHGAEGHYNTVSSTLTQLSGLTGGLWGANAAANAANPPAQKQLPPSNPASQPAWQRWSKVAMYAGAATAATAVGTAAYLKRDTLTSGVSWASSHLEFVGCLIRGEELQRRLQAVIELQLDGERRFGFVDLYSVLGKGAAKGGLVEGYSGGSERTFCSLPKVGSKRAGFFRPTVNDKAADEVGAHMTMFFPRDNPGFYDMGEVARDVVVEWVERMLAGREARVEEGWRD